MRLQLWSPNSQIKVTIRSQWLQDVVPYEADEVAHQALLEAVEEATAQVEEALVAVAFKRKASMKCFLISRRTMLANSVSIRPRH